MAALAALFAIAFVAATILPAQSEAALVAMILDGSHPTPLLIAVASLGNVLGSTLNWLLGRGAASLSQRRWFPVSEVALDRASVWYRRYGRWSLLLSWMPIIGDPLTVAAGVMREPFWSFVTLVTIAKTLRYCAVAAVTLNLA